MPYGHSTPRATSMHSTLDTILMITLELFILEGSSDNIHACDATTLPMSVGNPVALKPGFARSA